MIMAGYEFMDDVPEDQRCPFETVNIHATVLDAKGRRMSKSAGNGIDPIDMIEQYGADAVRYSLILLTKEGQDTKLAPDKFEQGWRFGNKVWNAARFVLMNLEGERTSGTSADAARLEDRWILSRLAQTTESVTADLEAYSFNDAAMTLYRFVWNDFCDWYLELAKPRFTNADDPTGAAARGILARVLGDVLALLHPFTPYMTEVLWKALGEALGETRGFLMEGNWPTAEGLVVDEAALAEMDLVQDAIQAVRRVRVLTGVSERKPLAALFVAPRDHERAALETHAASVRALALLEGYEVAAEGERPAGSAAAVAGGVQIFVQLGEDVDFEGLKAQLAKKAEKLEKGIAQCDAKLGNERFVQNADPDVVAAERERRAELDVELTMLRENLAGF